MGHPACCLFSTTPQREPTRRASLTACPTRYRQPGHLAGSPRGQPAYQSLIDPLSPAKVLG